jgi:hypothetical protein
LGPRLGGTLAASQDSAGLQLPKQQLLPALEINEVRSECQPEHAKSQVIGVVM